ncbi:MAG: NADPH:quinone oxidoreductase family protein, partial [Solirubrobacterales bacterium]|nr:NADPH:quinone oxidoreductase family protein [Solirubrobacterales bacterium]
MRAIQITELSGPRDALKLVEVREPAASDTVAGGDGVVVEVRA